MILGEEEIDSVGTILTSIDPLDDNANEYFDPFEVVNEIAGGIEEVSTKGADSGCCGTLEITACGEGEEVTLNIDTEEEEKGGLIVIWDSDIMVEATGSENVSTVDLGRGVWLLMDGSLDCS